jgi:acyl-CoA synthetase (NDP forming)
MTEPGSTRLLPEVEGLRFAADLGLGTPACHTVDLLPGHAPREPAEEQVLRALSDLTGERVVLKAVAEDLVHKSEAGGVRILARDFDEVMEAAGGMVASFGEDLSGLLIQQFVEHDPGPSGELLIGLQVTPEFGPVVTVGPGGRTTELWAGALSDGQGPLHLSPDGWSVEDLKAALLRRAWFRLVSDGFRGEGGHLPPDRLISQLLTVLDRVQRAVEEGVREAEFNPVAVTPDGLVALDAVVRFGALDGSGSGRSRGAGPRDLSPFVTPESVAIMGVSARAMNPGRIILRNTLEAGFPADRLYVIRPGADELDGCRCVGTPGEVPGGVDLLVLAIPAERIPVTLDEIIREDWARGVVLIPGGLGEVPGTEDRVLAIQAALSTSPGRGPLVNGGNCLGLRSLRGRVNTLFIPGPKLPLRSEGADSLALIAQSGAFAVARLSGLPDLNPDLVVTVGNQVDLTLGDWLTWLEAETDIRVAGVYAEGFQAGDGRRFLTAVRAMHAADRAVVLYRAGRSVRGLEATATHTASIAGPYSITAQLAEEAGALVCETLNEFDAFLKVCLAFAGREPKGRRLALVTNAGFEAVGMADHASGLDVGAWDPEVREVLAGILREAGLDGIVTPSNPLDLTPMAGDAVFGDAVAATLAQPHADLGVVGCVPLTGALRTLPGEVAPGDDGSGPGLADRLESLWAGGETAPFVVVVDGGPEYDPFAARLSGAGIPTFRRADAAVRAVSRYVDWRFGVEV